MVADAFSTIIICPYKIKSHFFSYCIIARISFSNNIAVDPAVPVILSKAKYLCSVWL